MEREERRELEGEGKEEGGGEGTERSGEERRGEETERRRGVKWAPSKMGTYKKIATVANFAGCPIQGLLALGFGHGCCSVFVGAGRWPARARRFDPRARLQASALQTHTCLSRPPSNQHP